MVQCIQIHQCLHVEEWLLATSIALTFLCPCIALVQTTQGGSYITLPMQYAVRMHAETRGTIIMRYIFI